MSANNQRVRECECDIVRHVHIAIQKEYKVSIGNKYLILPRFVYPGVMPKLSRIYACSSATH